MTAFERLARLYFELGLDVDAQGNALARAEVEAICKGIEMVAEMVDSLVSRVKCEGRGLDYIALTGECSRKSKSILKKRMGAEWGVYDRNEYNNVLLSINGSIAVNLTNGVVRIVGYSINDLEAIGEFIRGYVPAGVSCKIGNGGYSWDDWDDCLFRWGRLDKWGLPFNCIENLEVSDE